MNISIPFGSINREEQQGTFGAFAKFQFLLVRLIDSQNFKERIEEKFQFLLVRLIVRSVRSKYLPVFYFNSFWFD